MRPRKATLLIILTAALIGCGGFTKGKPAAEKAITQFRTASTKQKYEELMAAVQRKLGKVTSTSNSGWRVQSFNLQTTVLMSQNTTFEHGQGTESFTFALNGTNAALVAYNIQSMDLITK